MGKTYTFFLYHTYPNYREALKNYPIKTLHRYWFNGRPMTREFVGIAALGVSYDITWGDRIYQGDAAGAGITFGYALNLNRRLNVEFYGGFGAVYFKQKQYYKNDNIEDYTDGTAQANANGYKLLPIKIGVSISYIFK